ncbi:MAG: hypothetical protein HQ465_06360 [Rhodospirillales bacterium]|nr:hypothetical protein [Rhodospirillales bacterium]
MPRPRRPPSRRPGRRNPPRWQGFCGKLSDRLDALIAAKRIWNVRGVLIVRDGKLVLER